MFSYMLLITGGKKGSCYVVDSACGISRRAHCYSIEIPSSALTVKVLIIFIFVGYSTEYRSRIFSGLQSAGHDVH